MILVGHGGGRVVYHVVSAEMPPKLRSFPPDLVYIVECKMMRAIVKLVSGLLG